MNRSFPSVCAPAVGTERVWQTNPVWCLERLLDEWYRRDSDWLHAARLLRVARKHLAGAGIRLAPEALTRWAARGLLDPGEVGGERPRPGVVGLVIDPCSGNAWVAPLKARRSAEWAVAANLPMRPAAQQDLLMRLILRLGLPQGQTVPERFAFVIEDGLGLLSNGPSMDVAGLLAVLDAANEDPELFRCACAVVQADGDRLVPVGGIAGKLHAFRREYGRGTLLVRAADCPAASAFDGDFDTVWLVESFGDLAQQTERACPPLLRVFLESVPLGSTDLAVAHGRLRTLLDARHDYAEALSLARRLQHCPWRAEVPAAPARELRRTITDLYRHLGYYEEAECLAVEEARRTREAVSCHDEQAQADVIHAAALYDPHRFADLEAILLPWVERLDRDPLLAAPETRVMIFNTLARAQVILGRDGWPTLFQRSLDILRQRDPLDLPRTWNYLAHGRLRQGRLDEAALVLADIEGHPAMSAPSRWALRFLQAEHSRQRGRSWSDEEMEAAPGPDRPVGHPFGFYFQATARQPGRRVADAQTRFLRARQFFLQDAGPGDRPNILHFLADVLQLAEAAWADDLPRWQSARTALARHLQPRPKCRLAEHYAEVWLALGTCPDIDRAEAFLRRVPYF